MAGFNKLSSPSDFVFPRDLISIREISMDFIEHLIHEAEVMKNIVKTCGGLNRFSHKILASVFYEPSTRTSVSFQAAMLRLGGQVININDSQSSVKKGESLEDTIQTVASYCDIIVLRHPVKGSAALAASVSTKPVINAGDGVGEHPTQALLDLFTIKAELGFIGFDPSAKAPMKVALLGDLKNGRTVHSLVYLLSKFPGIEFIFCSPPQLSLPDDIIDNLNQSSISQKVMSLDQAIAICDVLYVTRVQKERFACEEDYLAVKGSYCVNNALMALAKPKMIVMHPLPRVDEIATEVDSDPRAAYFRQMENGMYVRMAILDALLSKSS